MINRDLEVFTNDDEAYLGWLSAHPLGFVLNADRAPRATYLKLHRATCHTIRGIPTNGTSWTKDLLKACSDDRVAIERWAQSAKGASPSACGRCHPDLCHHQSHTGVNI
jgi:hypothetical protein